MSASGSVCAFQLLESPESLGPESGRVARDRRLTGLLDSRHSAIESGDELLEFAHQFAVQRLHVPLPLRISRVRAAFQMSPQLVQRL
jgi:hypothetical protein